MPENGILQLKLVSYALLLQRELYKCTHKQWLTHMTNQELTKFLMLDE